MEFQRLFRLVVYRFAISKHESCLEFFEWLVKRLWRDCEYDVDANLFSSLSWLIQDNCEDVLLIWLKYGPKDAIDTCFPALCRAICRSRSVSKLLTAGVKPHGVTTNNESPTSLAMHSSHAFLLWRTSLFMADIDINTVLDEDLNQGMPLRERGWTRLTLRELFDWHFEDIKLINLDLNGGSTRCADCTYLSKCLMVQPLWVSALEQIKNGTRPEDTVWARRTQSNDQAGFESDHHQTTDSPQETHGHHESFDSSQETDAAVIPKSHGSDQDEETESLSLPSPKSVPSSPAGPTVATQQETWDDVWARSIESELDAETEDFVSVKSELDADDSPFPYEMDDCIREFCWSYFQQYGHRKRPSTGWAIISDGYLGTSDAITAWPRLPDR